MAGVFGIFGPDDAGEARSAAARMAQTMRHLPGQHVLMKEEDAFIAGAAPSLSGNAHRLELPQGSWALLVGEAYPRGPAAREVSGSLQAAAIALRGGGDIAAPFLGMDGVFVACLFDALSRKLLVANDLYGGLPIFFARRGRSVVFASEVKAVAEVCASENDVDASALQEFVSLGYLRRPRTYFRNIQETPFGHGLVIQADTGAVDTVRLHSPGEPAIQPSDIGFEEAKARLAALLRAAVAKRLEGRRNVVVTLSGGLDSRFLAAEAARTSQVRFVTFGRHGSPEVAIAEAVAARLGAPHEVVRVDEEDWLHGRKQAVWMTDGLQDLLHGQIVHVAPALAGAELVLDGFAGDHTVGGAGISVLPGATPLEKRLMRLSRFTFTGPRIEMNYAPMAFPFIDRDLVEFADSLPQAYKAGSRIYIEALADMHRDLYSRIPWHKTGRPAFPYQPESALRTKARRLSTRLRQGADWLGLELPGADRANMRYYAWMHGPAFRREFHELLYGSGARLRKLIPVPPAGFVFSRTPHPSRAHLPARLLTLEIWLRRSFSPGEPFGGPR